MSSGPPPIPYATPTASNSPVPPLATPAVAVPTPALTPEHLALLARAKTLYKPIRRAAAYARFESITLILFGLITLLTSFSPPLSPASIFVGVMLCATGLFEYQTAARLRQLDAKSPPRLALNQLVLGGSLLLYALFRLYDITHNGAVSPEVHKQFADAGVDASDLEDLTKLVLTLVYYSLIVVALLGCGLTALYYRTRQRPLQTYLTEIPDWARTLTR